MKSILQTKGMNKGGKMDAGSMMAWGIMALIVVAVVVLMITAIAPSIFANASSIDGAPSFFNVIWPILISVALILILVYVVVMLAKQMGR